MTREKALFFFSEPQFPPPWKNINYIIPEAGFLQSLIGILGSCPNNVSSQGPFGIALARREPSFSELPSC